MYQFIRNLPKQDQTEESAGNQRAPVAVRQLSSRLPISCAALRPHMSCSRFVRLAEAKRLLRTTRRIATSPTAGGPPEQWVRHVSSSAQEKICTKRGSLRRKSCEVTAGPTQKSKFLFTFFPLGVLSLSFLASPFATHATRVFLAATQSPPREIRRQIPSSYRQIDRPTGMMAPSSSPLPPHRSKMTLV